MRLIARSQPLADWDETLFPRPVALLVDRHPEQARRHDTLGVLDAADPVRASEGTREGGHSATFAPRPDEGGMEYVPSSGLTASRRGLGFVDEIVHGRSYAYSKGGRTEERLSSTHRQATFLGPRPSRDSLAS